MGSLIGDACGAPLEFTKDINKNTVEAAVDMKGGGIYGVTPGQRGHTALSNQTRKSGGIK